MFRIFAILSLCALAGSTLAQSKATTAGNNSPAITAGNGANVSVTYDNRVYNVFASPAKNINDAVKNEKDPIFIKTNQLVDKGDYKNALRELEKFSVNNQQIIRTLALARYIEAQIYVYDEKLDLADIFFGMALNLQPENCAYRFSKGHSLLNMGRLWDAEQLLSINNADTAACFASGSPAEKANLYLVTARVAFELRDQQATFDALDKAYREIKHSKNESSWAEPACVFLDLVNGLSDSDRTRWPDYAVACQDKLQSPADNKNSIAIDRFRFYEALRRQSGSALYIGIELQKTWPRAEAIETRGLDIARKRFMHGGFISDLGMQFLWTGGDTVQAAELYRQAYDVLEPLLATRRNSVIAEMMQLIIRIKHLDSMSPSFVFSDRTDRFKRTIALARKYLYLDNSYRSCVALDMINSASQGIPGVDIDSAILRQTDACFRRSVPPESWTAIKNTFEKISETTNRDLSDSSIKQRIKAREVLFGFPSGSGIHAEQAFDLFMLILRMKNTENFSAPEYEDLVNRAIIEANEGFPHEMSGFIISQAAVDSTLPSSELNVFVQKQLKQLVDQSDVSVSDLHLCHYQATRSESVAGILAFALKYDQTEMVESAARLWKKDMNAIKNCVAKPESFSRYADTLSAQLQSIQMSYALSNAVMSTESDPKKLAPLCEHFSVCKSIMGNRNQHQLLKSIFDE